MRSWKSKTSASVPSKCSAQRCAPVAPSTSCGGDPQPVARAPDAALAARSAPRARRATWRTSPRGPCRRRRRRGASTVKAAEAAERGDDVLRPRRRRTVLPAGRRRAPGRAARRAPAARRPGRPRRRRRPATAADSRPAARSGSSSGRPASRPAPCAGPRSARSGCLPRRWYRARPVRSGRPCDACGPAPRPAPLAGAGAVPKRHGRAIPQERAAARDRARRVRRREAPSCRACYPQGAARNCRRRMRSGGGVLAGGHRALKRAGECRQMTADDPRCPPFRRDRASGRRPRRRAGRARADALGAREPLRRLEGPRRGARPRLRRVAPPPLARLARRRRQRPGDRARRTPAAEGADLDALFTGEGFDPAPVTDAERAALARDLGGAPPRPCASTIPTSSTTSSPPRSAPTSSRCSWRCRPARRSTCGSTR